MRRIAVDTNVLLLLLIGSVDPAYIARHKRLGTYRARDHSLLLEQLVGAEIVVTPTALAEVSNLATYGVQDPLRTRVMDRLRQFIQATAEHYRPSRDLVGATEFGRLGLPDCSWLDALDTNTVLLTDDLGLYNAALARKLSAMNFAHIRRSRGLI